MTAATNVKRTRSREVALRRKLAPRLLILGPHWGHGDVSKDLVDLDRYVLQH